MYAFEKCREGSKREIERQRERENWAKEKIHSVAIALDSFWYGIILLHSCLWVCLSVGGELCTNVHICASVWILCVLYYIIFVDAYSCSRSVCSIVWTLFNNSNENHIYKFEGALLKRKMAKTAGTAAVIATGNRNINSYNDGNKNRINEWESRHTEIRRICIQYTCISLRTYLNTFSM